jgi:glycine/D-amino acid oxidase-like deaminating enzyme
VTPAPAAAGEIEADVAIVGGGYAGMWTALALRQRDPSVRVVLLEARVCGEGPSGRNAGFANSFWHHFAYLADAFGSDAALELCELGDRSVGAIGEFAEARGADVAFRKAGHLKVSTSPAQDGAWLGALRACEAGGAAGSMTALDGPELRARCDSPLFREGAYIPQAATVQPALLARALREAMLDSGIEVAEHSPARSIGSARGGGVEITTDAGARVRAGAAVLAINAASAGFAPLRSRLAVTSTHMIVTEPVPDVLEEIGWTGRECISTSRRYLHYFRTTEDGRIAFGWGAGRVAYGARLGGRVEVDSAIIDQLRTEIVRFFPGLRGRRIDAAWGGPVDVSPTHLPSVGTLPGARIHFVCGFTGNGVGPSHLAGETLASLALGIDDELTRSALVDPAQAPVPPEPLRWVGGTLIRAALLRQEALEDAGRAVDPLTRLATEMPGRLGIHIGR